MMTCGLWFRAACAPLALFFLLVQASVGATYYVATNGNDAADGTSWATAKQTIQAAIDLTVSNDTVLVSNGVYATGGRVVFGAMTNRVAITNAITVRSVNGPDVTVILGAGPPGNAAVRCVYVGSNATLSGFTLTNGATRTTTGDAVAEQSGGGVWCATSAVVSNCTLTGNSAGRLGSGGGSYGGTLNNCSLIGNTSSGTGSGGGGGGSSGGTLNNCILTGNRARTGGGAHQATLNNCTLTGNVAGQGGGSSGGTLNNCVLAGNSSTFQGGGSYLGTLNNCTLTGNTATPSGGGSYNSTLNNCTLTGNSATSEGGGSHGGTLNNCTLVGNSAASRGGGAYASTLNNCILTGNAATSASGGGAANSRLNNCMVTGNSAALEGGGSYGGILKNCTVVGNSATNLAGGAYESQLYNCIVWSNSAPTNANYVLDLVSISNSCTTPMPTNGTGNITNDPQFVSLSTTNLQLSETSPCINTGDNANAPTNAPFDLAGNPRIINGIVDMGAYEFQPYWLWAAAITNGLTNYNDSATGDGYPNLLKYVTGSSPTNADGLAAFDYLPLVVGQEVVTYEEIYVETNDIVGGIALLFNRNTNATDASLFVETANATTNGTPWTPIAANILGSWGGNTNVTETGTGTPVSVRVADPSDGTNTFFRLRVTVP